MKRRWIVFTLFTALLLAGCAADREDKHPEWEESWTRLGDLAAVEPLEGFSVLENMDALTASGLYYASWSSGQAQEITNGDGQAATAYDAQIYMLLKACRDGEDAAGETDAWLALERKNYESGETAALEAGGQSYTLLPLLSGSGDNPYTHGAAAFAVRGAWAVSVELVCGGGFRGDPQGTLEQFLSGIHYGNEQED